MTPEALQPIIMGVIALLTPMLIAFIKTLIGKIPDKLKVFIPVAAPIIGLLLDLVLSWLAKTPMNPWTGLAAGAAGVFVREVKDQLLPAPK